MSLEEKYFPPTLPPGSPNWQETLVITHVDGDLYFAAIADALNQCKGPGDKIYITSWSFDASILLPSPQGLRSLEDILVEKHNLGADVRLIVAAPRYTHGIGVHAEELFMAAVMAKIASKKPQLQDVVRENIRTVRRIRERGGLKLSGGILLDWSGRNDSRHEKVTVIYDSGRNELRAFVGGIDYESDRKADEAHSEGWWHDVGIEVLGGAASTLAENFHTRWVETVTLPYEHYELDGKYELFNDIMRIDKPWTVGETMPKPLPENVPPGQYLGASVRRIRSYEPLRAISPWRLIPNIEWQTLPKSGVKETLQVLLQAIGVAESYIYIEDQTLNPGDYVERLYSEHMLLYPAISNACAKGTKVIFVTSGYNGPNAAVEPNLSMSLEVRNRILSPLTPVQRQNFALFYIRGTKVHSKVVLIDDQFALIGSANMWDRSMKGVESEIGLALVQDGPLVADLRVRLWAGHLRVLPKFEDVKEELRDTTRSFGIFRESWGTGVTFDYKNSSALVEMKP